MPESSTSRIATGLLLVLVLAFLGQALILFGTETEDAYIFFRYAANLVDHASLTYNLGDRVSSLTSPLHALVLSGLHWLFGDPRLSNKLWGLTWLLIVAGWAAYRFRGDRLALLMFCSLVLISPYVLIWTFGGLETPFLMATTFIIVAVAFRPGGEDPSVSVSTLLFVLGGLCFVTRYDSSLFWFPILVVLALRRPRRERLAGALLGGFIPAAWLVFAQLYYGDVLPNSFYVKQPRFDLQYVVYSGLYMLEFYIFSGIALFHFMCIALAHAFPEIRDLVRVHLRERATAYAGLILVIAYGFSVSTLHMFYSFRLLVPYSPVVALFAADLVSKRQTLPPAVRRIAERAFLATAVLVVLLQMANFLIVWQIGLSGARIGEFRRTNVGQMSEFVQMYSEPADSIREHWGQQASSKERALRLHTFAAGALPFELQEAYVYEGLSAYRHKCRLSGQELRAASDYICVLTPLHGSIEEQLPAPMDRFVLVYEKAAKLENVMERYMVFFNPSPTPHRLPARVDGECRDR